MTGRAVGLLDALFLCPITNVTEEEPGIEPAAIWKELLGANMGENGDSSAPP